MKLKVSLAFFFFAAFYFPASSQSGMFMEAFQEFSTSRMSDFEEIPINWKMEGLLQADLNEGLNHLLENNPSLADASLSLVIEKDSTVWQAYYYRSAARKQLKKYWLAQKDIQQTLKLHGDFYEGLVELAKIHHLRRNSSESERTINKAIRLDRSRGTAYYLKGDINLVQNELRNAVNNYKDCLAADSMFHDARIKIALMDAISRKDPKASLKHLNIVLTYDSLQKTALLFRAVLGQDNDKKQSVRDLTNLLRVSPNNLMALYYRGLFSTDLGDFERAFTDFHNVIKFTSSSDNEFTGQQTWLDKKIDLQNAGAYTVTRVFGLPDADAYKIKQAYCLILLGEYDKSILVIDQVSNARQEPVAVYLKAVAFEHKGSHILALQYYDMALGLDNEIADAYKKRGIYEQEMKQWDRSIQDFNKVLQFHPDAFFTNRMRGVSYYHVNKFKEALADFNTYLKNDSTNKEVMGFRGMAYLQTNQRLKAYVDFAASDNPQSIDVKDMENLVDSVLIAKDTTTALQALNVITKELPQCTEAYVQKIRIHMARHEWQHIKDHVFRAIRNSRLDAEKSKHSYLLTVQALVHLKDQHTEDAISILGDAIKSDKNNDFAFLERGRIYLQMGKSSKARNDLQVATDLGNQQARALLATLQN